MATAERDSAYAVTLDTSLSSPGRSATMMRAPVALVQGSSPHLSGEVHDVLRTRLRAVAIMMFIGFTAFLIRTLLFEPLDTLSRQFVLADMTAMSVISAALSYTLCRSCPMSMRKLRVIEMVLFVAAGQVILASQWLQSTTLAATQKQLPQITPAWLLLIFTYALLIPNSWKRAGIVTGCMAAVPVALSFVLSLFDEVYSAALATEPFRTYQLDNLLYLSIGVMVAAFGGYTIGKLRREAFRAKRLGQYRLKKKIGAGGMGEVYLAEHQLMKRPCAIKLIRPENAGNAQALARFEREVRATARLSHWNSIDIFDYGRSNDGTFYYVMEYLPGMNVGELVDRYGPLPAARAIHLLAQTCDALGEAHGMGLVHRDIKPGNVFAAHRGGVYDVAKLVDFGLAKPLVDNDSPELTQEGAITGSPLFMSPEQALGDAPTDARSDIYSLGAVGYFLVTGQPPFNHDKTVKILVAHAHEEVQPPSLLRSDVPDDLERIILRCLAKDPADRYPSVDDLRRDLTACGSFGEWDSDKERIWWQDFGCPQKKAFDAEAMQAACV